MDEQKKKQLIVAGALGAVLIGVLVYQLVLAGNPPPAPGGGEKTATGEKKPAPAKTAAKPKKGEEVNLLEATEIDIEELMKSVEVQPIDYSAVKIARNPMSPLVGIPVLPPENTDAPVAANAPKPVPKKEVTGIIWDDVSPVAIIDNMVVNEGYIFADGVVVQSIEPTRVLLKNGDSIVPLEMKEF